MLGTHKIRSQSVSLRPSWACYWQALHGWLDNVTRNNEKATLPACCVLDLQVCILILSIISLQSISRGELLVCDSFVSIFLRYRQLMSKEVTPVDQFPLGLVSSRHFTLREFSPFTMHPFLSTQQLCFCNTTLPLPRIQVIARGLRDTLTQSAQAWKLTCPVGW